MSAAMRFFRKELSTLRQTNHLKFTDMALAITSENLKTLMDSGKPLVVDFWAEWCGPCRTIAPIIDELAAEYEGRVAIGKCDVDDNNAVATQFSVRNIPTILFIKGGQVVDKQVGACPKSVLEEKITKLL